MKYLALVSFCILLLLGCKEEKRDGIISVDLLEGRSNKKSDFSNYKLIDSLKIIPLENSNSCIIGKYPIIKAFSKYILINSENTIFIFNNEGSFIRKIKNEGKGPGEYINITDFDFDEKTEQIVILDLSQSNLLWYNINGDYIKTIEFEKPSLNIKLIDSCKIVLYHPIKIFNPDSINCITIINYEGKTIKHASLPDKVDLRKSRYLTSTSITSIKGVPHICASETNTIYSIDSDSLTAKYYFDAGIFSIKPDDYSSLATYKLKKRMGIQLGSFVADNNYLYVQYLDKYEPRYVLIDIENNNAHFVEAGLIGIPNKDGLQIWPDYIADNNKHYQILPAIEYMSMLDKFPTNIRTKYPIVDVNDNPVVIKY